ncbi:MAG: RDD family protein [Clostridia bacterium]|nr:RDD family protein [Clostridia bacterium]
MNVRFKRLLAAVIDFYIICFLSSGLIGIITLGEFNVTYFSVLLYLVTCFLLFLFKDYAFKNKSIGKRVFKLKVAKIDGTKLTFIDILKRSVPVIFLLPVEVLLLIINNRRIGDIWAKTTILRDCNLGKRTDDVIEEIRSDD